MNKVLVSLLLTLGLTGVAQAAGDAEAGQGKVAVCAACHGADGNSPAPNFPKLASQGERNLLKQLHDINDIFWGDMYLLSIDIDGEEYVTVKYIQKSDREGYVKLVSQNPHHADKDVAINRIRAIALVKASIRMNSIR